VKTAAGIAGILLGIFSLTYVGIFGSMIGSAAGLLGSIPFQGNTLGGWADTVKMLSWLAPLATIVGGIMTFANPLVGGVVLGASAFLHWYLLGLGTVGKLFVLPIGATAALALFTKFATRSTTNPEARQSYAEPPSVSNTAGSSFDRAKWNALIQYDNDIALVAEKIRPLGQKRLDEFASAYLALNDKQYLPSIERKIVAAATAEAEANEQARLRQEEELATYLQDQERLGQERKEQEKRRTEARRRQIALWRDRIWGSWQRRSLTLLSGLAIALIAAIASWPPEYAESRDWSGMLEGIFVKPTDLGLAERAYGTSISLVEDFRSSPNAKVKPLQWSINVYSGERNNLGLLKQEQFNIPADAPATFAMLGSIRASVRRSGSGYCDSQLWISSETPINAHFNCSGGGVNYNILKRPSSRWAALGVGLYGDQETDVEQLYAVDLIGKRVVLIEGAHPPLAISLRGGRVLTMLDDRLPHIFDLNNGRRFAPKADQSPAILSAVKQIQNYFRDFPEYRFLDKEGTQLRIGPTKCTGADCNVLRLNITKDGMVIAEQ